MPQRFFILFIFVLIGISILLTKENNFLKKENDNFKKYNFDSINAINNSIDENNWIKQYVIELTQKCITGEPDNFNIKGQDDPKWMSCRQEWLVFFGNFQESP